MTLIELLVAMVVLAVFMGAIVTVLMNMFGSADKQVNSGRTLANVSTALRYLNDDVRGAVSPTALGGSNDIELLEDAVGGLVLSGTQLEEHVDLVAISPTSIVLHADADHTRVGAECVEYAVGGQGQLTRTVSTGCLGGRELQRHDVIPAPARGTEPVDMQFSVLVLDAACRTVGPVPMTIDLRRGQGGGALQLYRVQSIQYSIGSAARSSAGSGRTIDSGTITLRSRSSDTYRQIFGDACVRPRS